MGILPKVKFKLTEEDLREDQAELELKQGKTFLVDFQNGKMIKENGKLVKSDDRRAVKMWIEKVLLTEKNKLAIYMMDTFKRYGMEYREKMEGFRARPVLISEFRRELINTMRQNKEIVDVTDIDIQLVKKTIVAKFTVILKDSKLDFNWKGGL